MNFEFSARFRAARSCLQRRGECRHCLRRAASAEKAFGQAAAFSPNGWARVGTDNIVTVYAPASEMGQGVFTAMPLLIAEEMDLDWTKVRIEQAPYNPKVYGNPLFGGAMLAGASRTRAATTRSCGSPACSAAPSWSTTRRRKWGVPAAECRPSRAGRAQGSGRRMTLRRDRRASPRCRRTRRHPAQLKPMKEFRLIGKDMPRVGSAGQGSGRARYGIDVRPARHALRDRAARAGVKRRARAEGSRTRTAKKVAGVKQIVRAGPTASPSSPRPIRRRMKATNALKVRMEHGLEGARL